MGEGIYLSQEKKNTVEPDPNFPFPPPHPSSCRGSVRTVVPRPLSTSLYLHFNHLYIPRIGVQKNDKPALPFKDEARAAQVLFVDDD